MAGKFQALELTNALQAIVAIDEIFITLYADGPTPTTANVNLEDYTVVDSDHGILTQSHNQTDWSTAVYNPTDDRANCQSLLLTFGPLDPGFTYTVKGFMVKDALNQLLLIEELGSPVVLDDDHPIYFLRMLWYVRNT